MMRISPVLKFLPSKWPQSGSCSLVKEISTGKFPLQFRATPMLWAEPLKAKKRIDPAILKMREEKRRRKVEKMIRRRLKLDRQLKPIEENELEKCLVVDLKTRQRTVNVSEATCEDRIVLLKKWCQYKCQEGISDILTLDRLMYSQQKALDELRLESEELYQAAVKIDENLIPLKFNGPVETPSQEDYQLPDGEYIDKSRKWVE